MVDELIASGPVVSPGEAGQLWWYGTVPRVKASGGKIFHGSVCPDVKLYLKWSFTEAANTVAIFHKKWIGHYVVFLYLRLRKKKGGHAKAVGAIAWQLAEATYWMLKKG
ncbi:MAG: hypothetical protein ACTSO9_14920 [Candidatus Helarchaeota archaeon]